jgi:hypothetical protein
METGNASMYATGPIIPISQMDYKIWMLALYKYPTSEISSWDLLSKSHALLI